MLKFSSFSIFAVIAVALSVTAFTASSLAFSNVKSLISTSNVAVFPAYFTVTVCFSATLLLSKPVTITLDKSTTSSVPSS